MQTVAVNVQNRLNRHPVPHNKCIVLLMIKRVSLNMRAVERSERLGGVTLLGVPVFDLFVQLLDIYARGELLVRFYRLLPPFLTSPGTIVLCLFIGIALTYDSHRRQLRNVAEKSGTHLFDSSGAAITPIEKPNWALPLVIVCIVALIAALIVGVSYSLAYTGPLPDKSVPPGPPKFAYVRATSPRSVERATIPSLHIEQHSESPNSPNVVGNNNQFSYSAEPPNRFLNESQAGTFVRNLSETAPAPFWVIIETMNYDEGSEQMLFGHQLTDLLRAAHWKHLQMGVGGDIIAPLYTQANDRGITIATMPSLLPSAKALSAELNRLLIRNNIRGFDGSGITRQSFKDDLIVVIVGVQ